MSQWFEVGGTADTGSWCKHLGSTHPLLSELAAKPGGEVVISLAIHQELLKDPNVSATQVFTMLERQVASKEVVLGVPVQTPCYHKARTNCDWHTKQSKLADDMFGKAKVTLEKAEKELIERN